MSQLPGFRSNLSLFAAAALAVWLLATPAGAHPTHDRSHRGHGHHAKSYKHHGHAPRPTHHDHRGYGHRHFRHGYLHGPYDADGRAFVVPRYIRHAEPARYRPYYRGAEWYGPHAHQHVVYHFPVYTEVGLVYRPHYYCEGALYLGGHFAYQGKRLSVSVGF